MTVQDPTEQFSEFAAADAPPPDIRYHFLDVGGLKYGECIVVEASDVRIMIDGGHRSDFRGQPGYRSIPEQLEALFAPPPHKLTLLVVTHGHDDHIGCLLDLLTSGVIAPEFALMTDPHLGFGRAHDDVDDDRSSGRSALAAVLREEDVTDLADRELSDFIDAVATAEERYTEILDRLRDAGTHVHLHRGGGGRYPRPFRRPLNRPVSFCWGLRRPSCSIARKRWVGRTRRRATPWTLSAAFTTLWRS